MKCQANLGGRDQLAAVKTAFDKPPAFPIPVGGQNVVLLIQSSQAWMGKTSLLAHLIGNQLCRFCVLKEPMIRHVHRRANVGFQGQITKPQGSATRIEVTVTTPGYLNISWEFCIKSFSVWLLTYHLGFWVWRTTERSYQSSVSAGWLFSFLSHKLVTDPAMVSSENGATVCLMSMFFLEQGCDACIRKKKVPLVFYVSQEESKEEMDNLFIL